MDIMMGNWAAANLKTLAEPELHLYQEVIDMENPDLYRWMTGQAPIPAEIDNKVLHRLCDDLRQTMTPKVTVASSASFEGKVWE